MYTLLMLFCKSVVGSWLPIWSVIQHGQKKAKESSQKESCEENGRSLERTSSSPYSPSRSTAIKSSISPALVLGIAMVARGETGLLTVEIGYNNTSYVPSDGFITAIWAILLNTIIGPVCFGLLIKYKGGAIGNGPWGLVPGPNHAIEREMSERRERRMEDQMKDETAARMGNI